MNRDHGGSNSDITSSLEGFSSICELPGWSHSDFTRTGKLGIWNLSRALDDCLRGFPLFVNKPVPSSEKQDVISVVSAQSTVVMKDLHRLASLHRSMWCRRQIGYIGRTSFSVILQLWQKETGAFLLQNERQFVFIDKKTRKAQPLSQNVEKLKDQYPRNEFAVEIKSIPADPNSVYVTTLKAAASDMDRKYHVTQSVYYRFSLDAAYEAWKVGFLQNFEADPCEYEVESFEGKYAAETFAGDQISVALWEDDVNDLTLHFEIRKVMDNTFVMYQRIVFYPLTYSKL
jgi:acyl-CoA thioesterase FadM